MQTLPQTDEALAELVSALADGQLQDPELTQALDWLGQSEQGRQQWQAYHVLGDVLRGGRALAPRAEDAFLQRLRDQIQRESLPAHRPAAANDRQFLWRMVAGLAGLVFVSVAAWQVRGWQEQFGAGPPLAQGVPAVPQGGPASAPFAAAQAPGAEPPGMIRDAQLDALLAAHKQFGGASALQGPAGFLRSATFEGKAP